MPPVDLKRYTKAMKEMHTKVVKQGGGNAVYCLGLIGAFVYYQQVAFGFWDSIVAILKALVWPAFVIYDLLKFLAG